MNIMYGAMRRYETILGGGGAAGPLVGPAGVGSEVGMRGVAKSDPPRGRQQQRRYNEHINLKWKQ